MASRLSDHSTTGLTKIAKGKDMFILFVKGRHGSLARETFSKDRSSEAILLVILCLVACVIVATAWAVLTAKN